MNRRQRKTRVAILNAFTKLLSIKDFNKITVGEIIEEADIGRATFYAHFETKDFLLKEFCNELFCHLFDVENNKSEHKHIFTCNGSDSVFLHLFQHFEKNDNNILTLLSTQDNDLFWRYFKENLANLIESHISTLKPCKSKDLPKGFWKNYIISTFIETLKWWLENGMKESPETITKYFLEVV